MPLATCTASSAPEAADGRGTVDTETVALTESEPAEPELVFINLLPWGEVDFERGEFPSIGACNAFVRALPAYSNYTTPERCQPIADPVYCTTWRDDDDEHDRIGCFKGVGGCEIELRRHDLLAESGTRTIADRCQPFSLADAWARYQSSAPDAADSVQ